jgi:hypothetical protein
MIPSNLFPPNEFSNTLCTLLGEKTLTEFAYSKSVAHRWQPVIGQLPSAGGTPSPFDLLVIAPTKTASPTVQTCINPKPHALIAIIEKLRIPCLWSKRCKLVNEVVSQEVGNYTFGLEREFDRPYPSMENGESLVVARCREALIGTISFVGRMSRDSIPARYRNYRENRSFRSILLQPERLSAFGRVV